MKNVIGDEDSMIHILDNLLEEYETTVEYLERIINDPKNLLSLEMLRDKLPWNIKESSQVSDILMMIMKKKQWQW